MPLRAARSLGISAFRAGSSLLFIILHFFNSYFSTVIALAFFALLGAACNGGDEASGGEGANSADAGALDAAAGSADAGPRRPRLRYYMARTAERCEVYTVVADAITPRGTAPCPAYIEVGERIRLAGFTCQREGTPGREQPVVCPSELLLAERDDRAAAIADAGPDGAAPDGGGKKKP